MAEMTATTHPDMPHMAYFGSYECRRCGKEYIVNDGTWRLCTSDFCHDCLEFLNKQTRVLPDPEPMQ